MPLKAPEIEIPKEYEKHWRIYFDVSRTVSRINDGKCNRIPPTEWLAWQELTGVTVDYAIMRMMDEAYCKQMNIELEEYRERTKPQGS